MSEGRLTRTRMAVFGAGTGSIAAFNTLRQLFFAVYLTDVVGVDARLASFVALIGMAADLAIVPAIGAATDRARGALGRRRPFLLFGGVPAGLAFLVLWAAPPWASDAAKVAHVAGAWVLAHTLQSLVAVPYLALVPEIAKGYDERTALTAWRMVHSLAASLAVAIGAPMLLDATVASGFSRASAHLGVAAIFGAVAAALWVTIGATTREQPSASTVTVPPPLEALRDTWRNVSFRYTAAIYVLTWTAFELVALMMPFYLTYRVAGGDLRATIDVFGAPVALASAVLGVLLISALPAIPVWTALVRRYDKRIAFLAGISCWAVAEIGMIAVQPGQIGAILALAAVAGAGVATAHVLPDAMLPDAIDAGELLTGRRTEGSYTAMQDLLRKLASGLALFVALQGLGWSGYAPPPAGAATWALSSSASLAVIVLTGPAGVALLLAAGAVAWASPLTRARQAEVTRQLEAARARVA